MTESELELTSDFSQAISTSSDFYSTLCTYHQRAIQKKVTEIPLFFLKDRQSFAEPMGYTTYISISNISIENENGQSISNIPFSETNQSVQYVHCVRRFKDGYEVDSF